MSTTVEFADNRLKAAVGNRCVHRHQDAIQLSALNYLAQHIRPKWPVTPMKRINPADLAFL